LCGKVIFRFPGTYSGRFGCLAAVDGKYSSLGCLGDVRTQFFFIFPLGYDLNVLKAWSK
jgi:hypothetical protein